MELFPLHHCNFEGLINFEDVDYKNNYDVNQTHRHDYFEVIFFRRAGGKQIIDFEKTKISANQVSFIFPGQIHSLKRDSYTSGIVLQFKSELFNYSKKLYNQFLNFILNRSNLLLTEKKFEAVFELVAFLKSRYEKNRPVNGDLAFSYLSFILNELFLISENEVLESNNISVNFLRLLEKHIYSKKLVKDYSELLDIETKQLNFILQRSLGKKALELIHNRLLLEVKRLLLENKLSFKEISYTLNFDSQATFTRFIKKHTGKLPSELKCEVIEIHK